MHARYVVLRFRRVAISPGLLVPVFNKNMRLVRFMRFPGTVNDLAR